MFYNKRLNGAETIEASLDERDNIIIIFTLWEKTKDGTVIPFTILEEIYLTAKREINCDESKTKEDDGCHQAS